MSSGMSVRVLCKLSNRHPTIKFQTQFTGDGSSTEKGGRREIKVREAGGSDPSVPPHINGGWQEKKCM